MEQGGRRGVESVESVAVRSFFLILLSGSRIGIFAFLRSSLGRPLQVVRECGGGPVRFITVQESSRSALTRSTP